LLGDQYPPLTSVWANASDGWRAGADFVVHENRFDKWSGATARERLGLVAICCDVCHNSDGPAGRAS
jgi:hypothetical protein